MTRADEWERAIWRWWTFFLPTGQCGNDGFTLSGDRSDSEQQSCRRIATASRNPEGRGGMAGELKLDDVARKIEALPLSISGEEYANPQ